MSWECRKPTFYQDTYAYSSKNIFMTIEHFLILRFVGMLSLSTTADIARNVR